ncbi:MAG: tRNA (adenosine(37)-N6)-threonylcarbamoyltransferase complex dimerization subunit type 1 TsaB [Acidobacteria bacterium]|nr:tRNA (adenosine(37)-N6)-threonylcarbamoyltransferase complex dimerization subunit type 1 TsaB [Acidobacteriota bacterium]
MQWMLAIDTCGAEGAVALAQLEGARATVLAQRTLPGRETQERLMSSVEEVLREASVIIADVQVIAIATGPGSFTGVRIGIAAAKGFAEALNIPLIAVSRLRMLAHRAGGTANAWLDAGRGDVYVGEYQDGVCIHERMLTRAAAQARGGRIVVGEELLRDAGEWIGAPTIHDLVQLAANDTAAGKFADTALLDANYLRIPDAELVLRARQP